MIRCPKCKHNFSEIDQPCKKCDGGGFQWIGHVGYIYYTEPPSDVFNQYKRQPCARCNGSGVERSASNRNNRSRGSSNEYKAVKFFTNFWRKLDGSAYEFKRTPQSGGSDLAVGFDMAGDLCTNAPDFPFHCEAKRDKGWEFTQLLTSPDTGARLGTFIRQALADCPEHKVPLLWLMQPGPSQPTYIMILANRAERISALPGTIYGSTYIPIHGPTSFVIMSLKTFETAGAKFWRSVLPRGSNATAAQN